jgi:hypothetical protein
MVFYVRDPRAGFRRKSLTHAAIANPADDPARPTLCSAKQKECAPADTVFFWLAALHELFRSRSPDQEFDLDCLNTYCECVGKSGWNMTARDKMRLQCLMSASFPTDPNAGVQYCAIARLRGTMI